MKNLRIVAVLAALAIPMVAAAQTSAKATPSAPQSATPVVTPNTTPAAGGKMDKSKPAKKQTPKSTDMAPAPEATKTSAK